MGECSRRIDDLLVHRHTAGGRDRRRQRKRLADGDRRVCRAGCAYGGTAPADGVVLRDWPSGQRQERKRRGCRGVGIPASRLSRSRWLFSPQCAPDAGLLPDVRRYAEVAGSGNASELDTKCGHHGGRIDHGREVLVHSEGR